MFEKNRSGGSLEANIRFSHLRSDSWITCELCSVMCGERCARSVLAVPSISPGRGTAPWRRAARLFLIMAVVSDPNYQS